MKLLVTIFIFINALNLSAQYNLIPNGSFESYTTCPTSSNQLSYAVAWLNPTNSGTPDYYNGCSSTYGIPSYCNCNYAYQYANTGNAYTGIGCYGASSPDGREYIQTQLNTFLIAGKCYFISYYVNLMNWSGYGCNNLGLNLAVSRPTLSGSTYLLNLPNHISKFVNPIIIDTLNWVLISGIYIANGGENFVTIGNFKSDANTLVDHFNSSAITDAAYYLIDDVSVTPIDSIVGGMSANAGIDKNIALGDSTFIGQEISNLNCNWFILGGAQIATNTSGLFVKPGSPTTFVVEQKLCGTITYDTVYVMVSPTNIVSSSVAGNDFKISPNPSNGSFTINFNKQNANYIISIIDLIGQEVYNSNLEVKENPVNFNLNVTAGTYFVKIVNTNNKIQIIKKIIIQ